MMFWDLGLEYGALAYDVSEGSELEGKEGAGSGSDGSVTSVDHIKFAALHTP
jgi:hypothetical protein